MMHPYIYAGLPKAKMTYSEAYNFEKQRIIDTFGIIDFLENRTRLRDYVWLRHIFFYNLVNKYKIPPTKLATLCPYDRTTILHSIKTVEALMLGVKPDKEFMEYVGKVDLINLK